MEFKLNKIDTDLRHKLEEQTRDGKVHSKDGIKIETQSDSYKYRDKNQKKKKDKHKESFQEVIKEQKVVTVDGYKPETLEVEVTKEKDSKENYRGIFIDVKK
ncbi:hypothetical protein [Clostridium fungisolvens]|uniref:Uncharacterized protein n=1 Tax=Clostridium fungisolvens TaxID=1604897 RepID=A0A6V8SPH9_9CLOT|nr:hypothetical protein [Clostridium fungisolvens]GFP77118.1 hypothetical protein bsdtw1_03232 [Clostridium fungisolvens]